jgi:hypothetical protein
MISLLNQIVTFSSLKKNISSPQSRALPSGRSGMGKKSIKENPFFKNQ